MKKFLSYTALTILSFLANFFIFNYSFITQAAPYLSEEEKMRAGFMMFDVTIPGFAISSVVFAGLAYFIAKKIN